MSRRSRKKSRRLSRRNGLNKKVRTDLIKSENYEAGLTYGYNYRIKVQPSPVTTTKVDTNTLTR